MYRFWKKKSQEEIKATVFGALGKNVNYGEQNVLGVPASHLDERVFSQDDFFLKEAPFISSLIKNPNHIGCHTLNESESYFRGTHEIEKELIELCATDILKGEYQGQDGYVASGGTEANMQAIWIYRNYFMKKYGAKRDEIGILCSEDSHYSMDKGANILVLDIHKVPVNETTREITFEGVNQTVQEAKDNGKKYFIVVSNMMTTMFGSVDHIDHYVNAIRNLDCKFKIHIDGAFGGFYYPFSDEHSSLTFQDPNITSFTLDAHKMAQAPYGTGIFLIRKGYMEYANTEQASYVEGEDYTLIGSRSGANAIAVWMILMKHGPFGWQEKIFVLQKRAIWMCDQLSNLKVEFYRHPASNIITIRSQFIDEQIAQEYGLVPDNHSDPNWYKIVVMDHVNIEKLIPLIETIKKEKPETSV
ncbi:MAG: aspartate aminotransferase family protein [Cytophagales bacterium]|nr:aspartate aminotransferase family protein [Cytophagales bacterium]